MSREQDEMLPATSTRRSPPRRMPEAAALRARFRHASVLLASVRDIVDERAHGAAAPSWCARRGWATFLAGLPDDAVHAAERDGLAQHLGAMPGAPADLVALAAEVTRAVTLAPPHEPVAIAVDARRASPRKRAQVAAFGRLVARLAPAASRIVDIGSGHGHLTRHLAEAFGIAAEGWESDPARVTVATALAGTGGPRFLALDARHAARDLAATDLVVALHACGELGDHAVRAAAGAGAAIALVGCCLQKRSGDRAALVVAEGASERAVTLGHPVLGLGNARDGDEGVEADLATRGAARVHRMALRALLGAAGVDVAPGEEMRGVNRRRATGALDALVARAFAVRGLDAPSASAVEETSAIAWATYAHARRWELPRTMLARLVEVWVALDRAALLADAGHDVHVCLAFDARESPRNVAVIAGPRRPR